MAIYWAKNNGLWSTRTNWLTAAGQDAGELPTPADDVYANNYTITIDDEFHVNSIRNIRLTSLSIDPGGQFILSGTQTDNFRLTAYVVGGGVTQVPCLVFQSDAPTTGTLVGSLCAGDPSNTVLRPIAFRHTGTGTMVISGNCDGFINNGLNADDFNNFSGALINANGGTLTIVGSISSDLRNDTTSSRLAGIHNVLGTVNIYGSIFAGTCDRTYGLMNGNNPLNSIFILGSVEGSSRGQFADGVYHRNGNLTLIGSSKGGQAIVSAGIHCLNPGTVTTIIGNVTGGGDTSFGVRNTGTLNLSITGNVHGGNIREGVSTGSQGITEIVGNVYGNTNGAGTQVLDTSILNLRGDIYGDLSLALPQTPFNSGAGGRIRDSGTINMVGNIFARRATGVIVDTGTLNLTGNIYAADQTINLLAVFGVSMVLQGGTVNVLGNVYGSFFGTGIGCAGNFSKIIVDGTVKAGGGLSQNNFTCDGITNLVTNSQIYVRTAEGNGFGLFSAGDVEDRAVAHGFAIDNRQPTALVAVQNFKCGIRGSFPTSGVVMLTSFDSIFGEFYQFRQISGDTITFLRSQALINYVPLREDVRLGTSYGLDLFTGTLAVPTPSEVIFGVPIDDTTGTGFLSASETWAEPVSGLGARGSMGARLKGNLTINSLSALVTVLNT